MKFIKANNETINLSKQDLKELHAKTKIDLPPIVAKEHWLETDGKHHKFTIKDNFMFPTITKGDVIDIVEETTFSCGDIVAVNILGIAPTFIGRYVPQDDGSILIQTNSVDGVNIHFDKKELSQDKTIRVWGRINRIYGNIQDH